MRSFFLSNSCPTVAKLQNDAYPYSVTKKKFDSVCQFKYRSGHINTFFSDTPFFLRFSILKFIVIVEIAKWQKKGDTTYLKYDEEGVTLLTGGGKRMAEVTIEKVRLGKTNLVVTRLGWGGIPIQRVGEEEAVSVIRSVVEMGVDLLDTARAYTNSEHRIGLALQK